jgi:hypothetical protein
MPVNQKTGKTDRHIPNAEVILNFRIKQLKDQKGAQQAVSSTSAPHSPAPITAVEAPGPLLAIAPTASTPPTSVSAPVTAAGDLAASQGPSVHSVTHPPSPTLAAEPSTVAAAGPPRRAIPSLIFPNIPPGWQHGPQILLPPRQKSLRLQESNAKSSQASASVDGNLESRFMSLERRLGTMEWWKLEDEEWKLEDGEWKHQVEESLRKAGM